MNIDNINRVIAAVRAEPTHFVMATWNTADPHEGNKPENRRTLARNNPCNTAGCIGGWMDSLALADIEDGKMAFALIDEDRLTINPNSVAATFIGVEDTHGLRSLFHMDWDFSMQRFDRLPAQKRADAGARALEIFRDTGKSDWTQALRETGLLAYMRNETDIVE